MGCEFTEGPIRPKVFEREEGSKLRERCTLTNDRSQTRGFASWRLKTFYETLDSYSTKPEGPAASIDCTRPTRRIILKVLNGSTIAYLEVVEIEEAMRIKLTSDVLIPTLQAAAGGYEELPAVLPEQKMGCCGNRRQRSSP